MIRGLLLSAALSACGEPSPTPAVVTTLWTDDELATLQRLRLDSVLPADATNRWADDPAAAALGRRLFFDPELSPGAKVSCATCHVPGLNFTDSKVLSEGVGKTERHAPAIVGSQQGPWFFWDGRADSLWSQAAGPVEHPHEMASDRTFVVRHLAARYREPYEALFGALPTLSDAVPAHARPDPAAPGAAHAVAWAGMAEADREAVTRAFVNALKAIGAYERTLIPEPSRFDRYVDRLASDREARDGLNADELAGLQLFLRKGNCVSCHNGPFFTDRAFHNLGLPVGATFDGGRTAGAVKVRENEFNCKSPWSDTSDCPELRFLNPSFDDFVMAFKTPSLRNVTRTAPYTHAGTIPDLPAMLAFYNTLPGTPVAGHRELTLRPLGLTADEQQSLIAFLGTLESAGPANAGPP